jgi:hypothetical protein
VKRVTWNNQGDRRKMNASEVKSKEKFEKIRMVDCVRKCKESRIVNAEVY